MKKIAVITGASSGMGRDFVKMIDKIENCEEIWVIARRVDKLAELSSETEKKILPIELDLSDESIEDSVFEASADAVIANAEDMDAVVEEA